MSLPHWECRLALYIRNNYKRMRNMVSKKVPSRHTCIVQLFRRIGCEFSEQAVNLKNSLKGQIQNLPRILFKKSSNFQGGFGKVCSSKGF